MAEKYLIGVDLGSSFTKAAIFDTQGNALGDAKRDTGKPRYCQAAISALRGTLQRLVRTRRGD